MSDRRWGRSSLQRLSRCLREAGRQASPPTVRRLLDDLGYRLHANAKQVEGQATHPDRDRPFEDIALQRATFSATGLPQVSVDSKKKELVGNFKNAGRVWSKQAEAVNVHDLPADALGRAAPHGIYELTRNAGGVYVGQSADTPRFAVDARALVASGGTGGVSAGAGVTRAGGWGRQQQRTVAGLEAATASPAR